MPNACFRCKTPIESGGTFCGDCRGTVSPEELRRTPDSRLWMVVAAYPLLLVLGFVVVPLASLLLPAGYRVLLTSLASLATLLLLFAFMWALVADAEHVREREDTDWNPSRWGYWGLALVCLFGLFLPVPFVAGYHLYRRHTTVGLPRGPG